MHTETFTLTPVQPFRLAQTLRFLHNFAPAEGEQEARADTLTKAFRVSGQTIVARIAATDDDARLTCTLIADAPIPAETVSAMRDRIAFYLGTADDLRPFYAIGERDAAFAPIIADWYGYHQVKFPTPFENACWAVLSQRAPLAIARTMKDALIARYGGTLVVAEATHRAFPAPDDLAGATADDLQETIRNTRKAAYLHDVVRAFLTVDEMWLRAGPYDAVEAWLRAIPGIGPWSAAFVLIRGLGRVERIAPEDALLRAASAVYRAPMTPDGLRERAAQYGPWQGYWAHYLRVAA